MPTDKTAWPAYMYNDARTNVSGEKLSLPLVLAWKDDISAFSLFKGYPKQQLSSPAIADGALYAASSDSRLYSFDIYSGKIRWKFDAGKALEAPPAIAGERVYFGSSDGVLRCLERTAGKEVWSYQAKSEILSAPVVRDNRVFFSSSDDRVHALREDTGERLWSYARTTFRLVTTRVYGSPAYFEGKLYQFFSDGTLAAIDAKSGKELWTRTLVQTFDSSLPTRRTPLADGGLIYMIDGKNTIQALSSETGEVKNAYNLIKAYDFIVPDKRTLVIAGEDQVIAIDRSTGAIIWKKDIARKPVASIFAADGTLFLLSNHKTPFLGIEFFSKERGFVEALSLSSGETLWNERLKSGITANGSTGHSHIALLTNKGVLEVFRAK